MIAMIARPTFNPAYRVEVVEPEGVYLLSERSQFVLEGPLSCRLAPLLDGHHSAEDLVDALAGDATPAEVYYALHRLEQQGCLVEAGGTVSTERAGFWAALDRDAGTVERRLAASTVALHQVGTVPVEPFAAALAALPVRVGEPGDVALVLVDDYLQEGLAAFNAAALAAGRPWLLVKPLGTVLWVGPLFRPGQTGCWECLAQRLRGNRPVEQYLQARRQSAAPLRVFDAALPAAVATAAQLAALEIAKALAPAADGRAEATVLTLDLQTLEPQRHPLVRRPQCPRCGAPRERSAGVPAPLQLTSQRKQFTADGGHRAVTPEQTLARYGHHVSPITGAVSRLTRVPLGAADALHVYFAGDNRALPAESLTFLRRGLRSQSSGKGMTDAQARASGLGEALERYCGRFQGEERRERASYQQLGTRAIHPNACMLFSATQYAHRQQWNARPSSSTWVPEPFDEAAAIEWTPVWSLTDRTFKYLPTAYCYYGYPQSPAARFCWSDSNGNAAGNTLEEAILQGFLELVERDSVALWWYNRLPRPAVDLASFAEPYVEVLEQQYRQLGRAVWALDLTGDLGIPVFAALSRRTDQAAEQLVFGFGAHFDPRIGLLRALTEMNQCLPFVAAVTAGASGDPACDDPDARYWWQSATVANQPYLGPDATQRPRSRADYSYQWTDDVRDDVLRGQAIVERQGLELLVLDQTRPDIGLPVAKVFVPGLRHFWTRFAPGRLYDVPVKQGWLAAPLAEDQLNPIPMFM